jgi:hypothetical protein
VSQLTETIGKSVAEVLEAEVIKRIVTERLHRLDAIQLRWDRVHTALDCRAREDYDGMMATGIVIRKLRSIRTPDGKFRTVEEYEIDNAAVECLNSIERRAAIETGQEVDRADIKLRGGF